MNQRRIAAMAVRLSRSTLDPEDGSLPTPKDGLEAGQEVRWRPAGRSRWRYGHLGDPPVAPDGSLTVYDDDFNGGARALRANDVERRVSGPRGGRRWVPCGPADDPQPDAHAHREDRVVDPAPAAHGAPEARTTAARRLDASSKPNEGLGL